MFSSHAISGPNAAANRSLDFELIRGPHRGTHQDTANALELRGDLTKIMHSEEIWCSLYLQTPADNSVPPKEFRKQRRMSALYRLVESGPAGPECLWPSMARHPGPQAACVLQQLHHGHVCPSFNSCPGPTRRAAATLKEGRTAVTLIKPTRASCAGPRTGWIGRPRKKHSGRPIG